MPTKELKQMQQPYLPCPEQFHISISAMVPYQQSIVVRTQNRAQDNRGVIL